MRPTMHLMLLQTHAAYSLSLTCKIFLDGGFPARTYVHTSHPTSEYSDISIELPYVC